MGHSIAALIALQLASVAPPQTDGPEPVPLFASFEDAARWVESNGPGVPAEAGTTEGFRPRSVTPCGGTWVIATTRQPNGTSDETTGGGGSFARSTVDVPAPTLRSFVSVFNQSNATSAATSAAGYLAISATYTGPSGCVGTVSGDVGAVVRQATEAYAGRVQSAQVIDVTLEMQAKCGGSSARIVRETLHAEDNKTSATSSETITLDVGGVSTTLTLNPDGGQISGAQSATTLAAPAGSATWFYAKAHSRGTAFCSGNGNLLVPAQLSGKSRAIAFASLTLSDTEGDCQP